MVTPDAKEVLRALALLGGMGADVPVSSREIADRVGVSQQTASRRIIDLEREGLIVRRSRPGARRQLIRLSAGGAGLLRRDFEEARSLFDGERTSRIKGVVARGLGEGTYYITREGYMRTFRDKLGYEPFPGTLNLRVDPGERAGLASIMDDVGILIPGFESEGRSFGAARCLPCTLGGLGASVILPVRTHHTDVLELLSPHHLRKELGLEDGDTVEVQVETFPSTRPASR